MNYRCALITGSQGGLGTELVKILEHKIPELILVDKVPMPSASGSRHYYSVDLSNLETWSRQLDEILRRHPTLDLVIANAGIDMPCSLTKPNFTLVRDHFLINTLANGLLLTKLAPHWISRRQGHFVSIASLAALRGFPLEGAYCASKSAWVRYVEAARSELEPQGIYFTTVFPGYIGTSLIEKNAFKITRCLSPNVAAQKIISAIEHRKRNVYFPLRTFLAIQLLNAFPEVISTRLARLAMDPQKMKG